MRCVRRVQPRGQGRCDAVGPDGSRDDSPDGHSHHKRSNQWGETSPVAELPMLEKSGQVTDMAGQLKTEQRERLILL